jgi:6-phosphofructokinase 2
MQSIMTLTVNPSIDSSSAVKQVVSDHKLRCQAQQRSPGGGGINVARAIHRLGGDALAVYLAGGPTGLLLAELLKKEGVRQHTLPIEEWTRENYSLLEESTQRQYRFIVPGPTVSEAEWSRCLDYFANLVDKPDYLVASGSLPPGVPADFYARLGRIARKNNMRFVLDSSGEPLRLGLREGVYLVKPSLREMCELVGKDLPEEPDQAEAAIHLVQSGQAEIVVLSLGSEGALLASAAGTQLIWAPAVRTKDRVGAGDSMVGGIVLGLSRGKPLDSAVRLGIAAGTASTLRTGTELCSLEDTERLLERMM